MFGFKQKVSEVKIDDIIKHNFCLEVPPKHLVNMELNYRPQYINNKLKPPKPTNTSKLRFMRHSQ